MSYSNLPGRGRDNGSTYGHTYQVHVGEGAKAHLGDTHNISLDNPLVRLPYAKDASFNSYSKQHDPTCLPDTRVNLLKEIYNWADGQDERCIFWLNGLAGTGKSTVARTVAHTFNERKRLGASFFFSRGGGDVSHAGKFVASIAFQLTQNVPALHQHICDAITERSDIASQSLRDQWHHLVLRPLSKLGGNSSPPSYVLVVDALDECDDDNIRIIVQLLAEARSLEMVRLRVFLTSRPEIPIRSGFCQIPDAEHQDFVLHNIPPSIVDHDIFLFLEYNLRLIGQENYMDASWPGAGVISTLVRSASGLFIWAATACRFIRDGLFADERLRTLIEGGASAAIATPEGHLNGMYLTVLQNSVHVSHNAQEKDKFYSMLGDILGSIVASFSPLSAESLSKLLLIPKQRVHRMLKDLHAILDIPEDQSRPLRLHHPSFREFLLDKERCGDPNFWVEEKQAHRTLAASCVRLMSTFLKQDICGVGAPGALVADVERGRVDQCLPAEIQYACLYWIQHLQKSDIQLCDDDQVHQFLKEHLLHWLEALGWMMKVSEGIHAIISLESMTAVHTCPQLFEFVHDIKRFILYSRPAIEQAPLQAYCSALVFAPTMSIVKRQFKEQSRRWIQSLPAVEKELNALLQTLEGHLHHVNAVAFSLDGKQLASASDDETVKLWDARSGAVLQTLEGHLDRVNAVVFSPDGKQLASASDDETVKLWDARSGAVLQTLKGHSDSVKAVAFSPDGKQLASASYDKTVKLCDARSGAVLQTLKGHSRWIFAVAFSLDGKQLASVDDDTVKLWDVRLGTVLQTLKGHVYGVNAVVFSPDSKQLASASDDETVKLWDARSGAVLQTLVGHLDRVNAVVFSPDGKQLASASEDETVKLWDAGSGALLQTLEGYLGYVYAVAFSPDSKQLASASEDKTVRLWDAGLGAVLQTLERHLDYVNTVVFSPDGKQLASVSDDKTVKLWDARSGAVLQTLEGHLDYVIAVAFSPDGKQLASATHDKIVKLWDARSGALLQTLKGHLGSVRAVAFSLDSKQLASASYDKTVKLWDARSGAVLQTLEGHLHHVIAVAFSPDGKQLASASDDKTVKLWDARSGAVLQTLVGHLSDVIAVAFSLGGKQLASTSDDKTVKLWDAGSGALLQTLNVNSPIKTLSFSNDGTSLQTEIGSLPITTPFFDGAAVRQLQLPSSILVKDQWICRHADRILWLPPEHRSNVSAIHGSTVGFGYDSGRVAIIEFAS